MEELKEGVRILSFWLDLIEWNKIQHEWITHEESLEAWFIKNTIGVKRFAFFVREWYNESDLELGFGDLILEDVIDLMHNFIYNDIWRTKSVEEVLMDMQNRLQLIEENKGLKNYLLGGLRCA